MSLDTYINKNDNLDTYVNKNDSLDTYVHKNVFEMKVKFDQ